MNLCSLRDSFSQNISIIDCHFQQKCPDFKLAISWPLYQIAIPFKMTQTEKMSNIFWFCQQTTYYPKLFRCTLRLTWFHQFGQKLLSKREGVDFFAQKTFWGIFWTKSRLLPMARHTSKHLKDQLWPRVSKVFLLFLPRPPPPSQRPVVIHGSRLFFHDFSPKYTGPNCILARRSSLGPPPGGRHRT